MSQHSWMFEIPLLLNRICTTIFQVNNLLHFLSLLNINKILINTHRKISKNRQISSQKVQKSWCILCDENICLRISVQHWHVIGSMISPSYRTIWLKTTEKGTFDISRKPQYKDVYRRTIEMPQRARTFQVNCCLKVHDAHLKLLWPISG